MGLEIERKFKVVDGWSPPPDIPAVPLRQGYLTPPGAHAEIRVRASGTARLMTVKTRPDAAAAMVRGETEFEIPDTVFEELWDAVGADSLSKVRRTVLLDGGLTASVDVYEGVHRGLRVVEVEFPDVAAAERFVPPAWFGEELTGVARWGNRELAAASRTVRLRDGGPAGGDGRG